MSAHQSAAKTDMMPLPGRRNHDRRENGRYFMSNEWAEALWNDGQGKVQVIELSATGMMIEAEFPAAEGDPISVRLGGCNPVSCVVRWSRDGRLGLEYAEETEVLGEAGVVQFYIDNMAAILGAPDAASDRRDGRERREQSLRLGMLRAATLAMGDRLQPVHVRNISPDGAMLALDTPLDALPGADAQLHLGPFGQTPARLRWTAGCEAGLEFKAPFDIARFNQ